MKSSTLAHRLILVVFTPILTVLLAPNAHSQATNQYDKGTPPQFAAGVSAFGSYTSADLGTVNLSNGALNLKIPLVNVGGRGLSLPITLNWSSKIWSASIDYDQERGCGRGGNCDSGQPSTVPLAYADYASADNLVSYEWRAEAGWTVGGMPFMLQRVVRVNYTNLQPRGPCYDFTLPKLTFTMPDRGEIEFRDDIYDGAPLPSDCGGWTSGYSRGRRWHATDGSGAIYITDEENGASHRFPNLAGVVITADGTRFYLNAGGGCHTIVDRNGNKITVTANGIVDSLGRTTTIQSNVADPDNPSQTLAVLVTVTGYGGQPRYYKAKSGIMNQHYRSDINPSLPVITGSYDPMSWGYSSWWPTTATKLFPLSYGLFVQQIDDRPVIYELVLPDQRSLRFNYNEFGEVAEVQMPTGGKVWYDYSSDRSLPTGNSPIWETTGDYHTSVWQVDRAVVRRRTFPDGNTLEGTWNYGYSSSSAVVTASAPDGTLLMNQSHLFLPYGRYTDSPYGGSDHTGTYYSLWSTGIEWRSETRDANGVLLGATEQDWTQRAPVSWPVYAQEQPANDNRVNQGRRYLDDGRFARTDMFYDNVNYPRANNVAEMWEYDFDQSLKRRTTTSYVTGTYQNDDSIHLVSLPLTQTLRDENGNQIAQTTNEYDYYVGDGNHAPLLDYGTVVGRDANYNATRTTRGNVTASGRWLNTTNSNIYSYLHYDIVGNVVGTKDARGNITTVSFADDFGNGSNPGGGAQGSFGATYALPTLVTSPPPNPGGQPHTARTQYDFSTGLLTGFRDRNGVVSQIIYNDPFNRPTLVRDALGVSGVESHTVIYYAPATTPYNITLANNDVLTAKDQNTAGDGVRRSWARTDGFGRTVESWLRDPQGDVKVHTVYDALGRAKQVSNPYRPSLGETLIYATTAYDLAGRVTSVTTPDNAVVSTSHSGNTMTVTDQAGRQRKSVTDALGRLVQVYEDPNGLNYLTSYSHDLLDNLVSVNQGSQTRTFVYDSFKRLVSASNPESGTVCYGAVVSGQCQNNGYDNNGNLVLKTDARGVVTNYVYDALNRLTNRSYNDATPTVSYVYDTLAQNGKGRLTSVSSSASTYSYSAYSAAGRPLGATQTIGSQNYPLTYTYDLAGHVKTMTYPSGRGVTNTFDDAGRLNSFTGTLGDGTNRTYSTGILYSALGGRAKEQFGTTTPIFNKSFYNSRGQLAEIRVSTSYTGPTDTTWNRGAIINHYSYQCWGMCGGLNSTTPMTDNNGNLRKQDVYIPGDDQVSSYVMRWQEYDYDSLNRLRWVREISGESEIWRQWYTYDRWGNRTIDQGATWGAGIPKPNFGVDTATNRLTAPAGYTMGYDQAGNQTTDTYTGQGSREYDAENKMKRVWANNQWQTYAYDGEAHRIKRFVNGTETWQVYGIGGELLAEYAANAAPTNPQKEYGYRNGELLIAATVTTGSGGSAFSFSDAPLVVNTTLVRSAHLNELRSAIDQARVRAGLSAAGWAESITAGVTTIKASHVTELRTRLDEARTALGLSTGGYTDPALANGFAVKAAHISELRTKTNEALTSGGGTSLELRWLVADQLGTPRMIFDQTGSLASGSRHDYLPFGEELFAGTGGRTTAQGYTNGDSVRQKFTSKERDNETGLDYFGARYYASTQGRFGSSDPLLSSGSIYSPQTWNRYSYTVNNPLKYTDPFGMYVCTGDKEQCKKVEQGLKNLEKARDAFKKGSNEYNRLDRSLKAYGAKGVDNGVTIKFGATSSNSPADTHISVKFDAATGNKVTTADNPTGQNITVTIDPTQTKSSDDYVINMGHEGSHVADGSDLVGSVPLNANLGSDPAVMTALSGPLNLTKYVTESRAYEASSFIAQGRGADSLTVGKAKHEIWNSGWREADRATRRTAGIDRVLAEPKSSGGLYEVTPTNQGAKLIQ